VLPGTRYIPLHFSAIECVYYCPADGGSKFLPSAAVISVYQSHYHVGCFWQMHQ